MTTSKDGIIETAEAVYHTPQAESVEQRLRQLEDAVRDIADEVWKRPEASATSTRRRANVSKNSRGYSWDCTVEMHDCTNEELKAELADLVALMERDYSRDGEAI